MANSTPYHLFSFFFFSSLIILFNFNHGDAVDIDRKHAAAESSHFHTVHPSSVLPSSVCDPPTKGSNKKVSLKVVHKHGPCYKPTQFLDASTSTQILTHDQSRVDSINARVAFSSAKNTFQSSKSTLPAKSGASLGAGNYIVNVGLGSPKKDLSLIFDTGSDLTWTQCEPCVGSCYQQRETIFDPSESTTYANISCNTPLCNQLNSATGNRPGCRGTTCIYAIQYGDQSFSIGYLAKDKLTLTANDAVDNFYYGCGQNNQGLFGSTAGLIGLARDKLSIISQTSQQFGSYFSYCLPSRSTGTGYLSFGKSTVSSGMQYTTFASSQGTTFYFIDILALYVGGQKLPISGTVFSNAGSIIDSGTVISRLPPGAYTPLRNTFRKLMMKYPLGKPLSILDTCFDFSNYTTVSIPTITFVFGGNVKVNLDPSGILYSVSKSQTCLAFAANGDASDVGIFGNVQQKTLDVVYDVAGGKLGFAPKGCA